MTTNPYQDAALDGSTPSVDMPSTEELDTLARLKAQFSNRVLATHTAHGDATALVDAAALLEIMTWLRDAEQYVMCASVTAYDDLGNEPRFYMVYHLLNMATPERIRIKVGLPEKKPVVDSVTSIWAGANYMEREVYDLMGIEFKGHPDLRRIMMPDSWEGHPLRRDYPHVYEEVQFTHNAAEVAKRKPFARS